LPVSPNGSVAKHDRADFAQEFLRRNRAYRAGWERLGDSDLRSVAALAEAYRWGLSVLFDPDLPVRAYPAIWRSDAASQIVSLAPAPADLPGAAPLPEVRIVAAWVTADASEIVLDRDGVRHRFRVAGTGARTPLTILLPPLGDTLRVSACDAARRMVGGLSVAEAASAMRPSRLQQQRLALLLRVLDAWLAGASNREIGARIVYPWLAGTDAAAWKGSAERRRVQRLIGEARMLADRGFRMLLKP